MLVTSLTLFLYSFGYGGITSFAAMYADASGTTPKGIYLTALAIVVLCTRPFTGRLGDRWGYKRVFIPCLVMICLGLACLAVSGSRPWMIASAVIFGIGFGTAYPAYVGYVMHGVSAIAAAPRSAPSSPRSIPASAPGRRRSAGSFSGTVSAAPSATAPALSALALPYS